MFQAMTPTDKSARWSYKSSKTMCTIHDISFMVWLFSSFMQMNLYLVGAIAD